MDINYKLNSKILSMLYTDRMKIERLTNMVKANGAIDNKYVMIAEDIKCRFSKIGLAGDIQTQTVSRNSEQMQVFIFSDVDIKKGDRITITNRIGIDADTVFLVGQVMNYKQHQTAILSIFDSKVK